MSSDADDASCSECNLELIEKKWTQLMLNWINRCVSPQNKTSLLGLRSLIEIMDRYKDDVCADELDYALLASNEVESFIKYKYPILRLRYLGEAKDYPKKLYIMTTILLYHCCANSQEGVIDRDICAKLNKVEQELILRFCENLSEMETTINNVDLAIQKAFEYVSRGETSIQPLKADIKRRNNKEATVITKVEVQEMYPTDTVQSVKCPILKFKSSITVMPSVDSELSEYSKSDSSEPDLQYDNTKLEKVSDEKNIAIYNVENVPANDEVEKIIQKDSRETNPNCQLGCACERCSATGPCCGTLGSTMDQCKSSKEKLKGKNSDWWRISNIKQYRRWWICCTMMSLVLVTGLIIFTAKFTTTEKSRNVHTRRMLAEDIGKIMLTPNVWQCEKGFCQKVYEPTSSNVYFTSLGRCSLLCMGPQLWPHPIGDTQYSNKLVALATQKLEYKFVSVPSHNVNQYLAEAFKLFIEDLAKLEEIDPKGHQTDLTVKKMNIILDVESDADPRMRYNTNESYTVRVETLPSQVHIHISSPSFCGIRHGLETLSQLILLDQSTGYLITLSNILVKDAPSYKYRGLMIDTARNYIPVADIMRTVDAMGTVKLNTFHWRISDATSFPWYLPEVPELFMYGAYDRAMVYTKQDIITIVHRAGIRGIRVLIEVAAPGPVGRAWLWSPDAGCPKKNDNFTCDNDLCLRIKMNESVFDVLQKLYAQILELTKVNDIFHLSDGLFSLSHCYLLIDDREGFLEMALDRLRTANKGSLPRLPIVWYTSHLMGDMEAKIWDKFGVQMNEAVQTSGDAFLSRFRVVHSSRWSLSCHMVKQRCTKYRTWQQMYAWISWKNIEVFSTEGGEAVLWTDLVDSGNLDYHLWPRLSAVAERLWSDVAANGSANGYTYARLDAHRWRMMIRGVTVQPVWPVYCSFNPLSCINKLTFRYKIISFIDIEIIIHVNV